jgi:hypothetical protein
LGKAHKREGVKVTEGGGGDGLSGYEDIERRMPARVGQHEAEDEVAENRAVIRQIRAGM